MVLLPASRSLAINTIKKAGLGRIIEVPEVDDLLNIIYPPYPYDKILSDTSQEPLFIVSVCLLVAYG